MDAAEARGRCSFNSLRRAVFSAIPSISHPLPAISCKVAMTIGTIARRIDADGRRRTHVRSKVCPLRIRFLVPPWIRSSVRRCRRLPFRFFRKANRPIAVAAPPQAKGPRLIPGDAGHRPVGMIQLLVPLVRFAPTLLTLQPPAVLIPILRLLVAASIDEHLGGSPRLFVEPR